ncbi:MAG: isoprenylcysteine carboxylmethyltransferase family protein [Alphaproteobacteria bacterium]|nr:isoprenylcysteine carboxylmethyltransferase family protein [Alphaproteobacteria bacterium]
MNEMNTPTPEPTPSSQDAPSVGMLPPMRFALFVIAGITLDWLLPLDFGPSWGWLGLFLVIAGMSLGYWAIQTFMKAGTNVPPNMPALKIVTDGPFQYTRNPMYIAFIAIYFGLALLADAPLMLVLTLAFWYDLNHNVIEAEEEYLTDKFGETYEQYKTTVGRWF